MRSFLALALLLLGASTTVSAQKPKKCSGEAVDTVAMGATPVYRDCDVDTPARLRGSMPTVQYSAMTPPPREGCFITEYEFIVDTLGRIEPGTIALRRSDDRNMEPDVRATLDKLTYTPAKLDKKAVRQLMVYRLPMEVRLRSSSGTRGTGSTCR